ncbi:hypothetical protein OESDEN_16531, partial [Oesophagostomum dentatum]
CTPFSGEVAVCICGCCCTRPTPVLTTTLAPVDIFEGEPVMSYHHTVRSSMSAWMSAWFEIPILCRVLLQRRTIPDEVFLNHCVLERTNLHERALLHHDRQRVAE